MNLLVVSAMGPIELGVAAVLAVGVVGGVWVAMKLHTRAVHEAQTTTADAITHAILTAIEATSSSVASEVGKAVQQGIVEGVDGVVRIGVLGPTPDRPQIEEDEEEGGLQDPTPPWMQWGDVPNEGWEVDPTDAVYPDGPSMAPEDRTVGVPPGYDPLSDVPGYAQGPQPPDLSGETYPVG